MNVMDIIALMNANKEKNYALCLCKGGFEGWLQVELWYYLNILMGVSASREVAYPIGGGYCDLVCDARGGYPAQWIEIKAFGAFRDGDERRVLESVGEDIVKIQRRPQGTAGAVYFLVPKAVAENVEAVIKEKQINYFQKKETAHSTIFYVEVPA
ncbi:MAG: hypothetical protein E6X49_08935 [Leclercia adecarboxylata]|nr:hypothetical protein [uncultured Leclercia sp.]MDU4841260.1 hypothetical protein [Leclercia adecarboxylata]